MKRSLGHAICADLPEGLNLTLCPGGRMRDGRMKGVQLLEREAVKGGGLEYV